MKGKNTRPVTYAILAAILYALSTPISKILMTQIPPSLLAGLLYLGAGFGMLPISLVKKSGSAFRKIDKKDLPYLCPLRLLLYLLQLRPHRSLRLLQQSLRVLL